MIFSLVEDFVDLIMLRRYKCKVLKFWLYVSVFEMHEVHEVFYWTKEILPNLKFFLLQMSSIPIRTQRFVVFVFDETYNGITALPLLNLLSTEVH